MPFLLGRLEQGQWTEIFGVFDQAAHAATLQRLVPSAVGATLANWPVVLLCDFSQPLRYYEVVSLAQVAARFRSFENVLRTSAVRGRPHGDANDEVLFNVYVFRSEAFNRRFPGESAISGVTEHYHIDRACIASGYHAFIASAQLQDVIGPHGAETA